MATIIAVRGLLWQEMLTWNLWVVTSLIFSLSNRKKKNNKTNQAPQYFAYSSSQLRAISATLFAANPSDVSKSSRMLCAETGHLITQPFNRWFTSASLVPLVLPPVAAIKKSGCYKALVLPRLVPDLQPGGTFIRITRATCVLRTLWIFHSFPESKLRNATALPPALKSKSLWFIIHHKCKLPTQIIPLSNQSLLQANTKSVSPLMQ